MAIETALIVGIASHSKLLHIKQRGSRHGELNLVNVYLIAFFRVGIIYGGAMIAFTKIEADGIGKVEVAQALPVYV